jgi:hypothetical protein
VKPRLGPVHAVLGALAAVGFMVRWANNDYGLPYVYNVDEGSHYTSRAVGMFGGDWDPGYYQNPTLFTYLAHIALRLRFGHGLPFGDFDTVVRDFRLDPTEIYVVTRTLAALLGVLGILAVYWAGKRLWGTAAGVAAAGVMTFAFLPVAYSRVAVTDVGTLATVAVAVWAAVRIREEGRIVHWLAGGVAAGLAIGFKYTAGLVLLPLGIAAVAWVVRERRVPLGALVAFAGCVTAFFVTNPYFFFELDDARRQLSAQADTAGDFDKVGQTGSGVGYYLHSLTWGLGWLAALAAAAGAVLEARRDWLRALILLAFPLALFAYLAVQARFFGRWLLPAYPVFALLAGAALARAAELVPRRRALALAGLLALVVAQPLAADARTMALLGEEDTRQIARDQLIDRFPSSLRVVIEPAVPARYYRRQGVGGLRGLKAFVRGFAKHQAETRVQYPALLQPGLIDNYRRHGFCLVMTMSVIRGRAENAKLPKALAYYDRLERESEVVFRVSPYRKDATPPKFDFDLSYNYYPRAFNRPGPDVVLYKLRGCKQQYGPLPGGTVPPGGIS